MHKPTNQSAPIIWSERWRLLALQPEELIRLGLAALMIGFAYVLFHFQGNTADVARAGRSTLLWVQFRWAASDGDMSHGYLIPFVSMALVWLKRDRIAAAPKRQHWMGLVVVVGALFMHYVGTKAQQPRLSVMSLILLIWSVPFYFYGWQVAKELMFPCAFLIFCIPLNFLDFITNPLKIFVSAATEVILNGLGIGVIRSGSILESIDKTFQFNVDDPCSGLRSLLALTAITAVYANLTMHGLVRKWLLFLASIPIAVVGNMARIITIGLVAHSFGQEAATGLYHDFSGYIFFPVAIGLMLGCGGLLNLDFRQLLHRFKDAARSPADQQPLRESL